MKAAIVLLALVATVVLAEHEGNERSVQHMCFVLQHEGTNADINTAYLVDVS